MSKSTVRRYEWRWRTTPSFDDSSTTLDEEAIVANLELHRRKIFWVDPALAFMLEHTDADIEGRDLRLPFPSFALVLNDRHSLSLGERLLSRQADDPLRGQILRVATVYVTERHHSVARSLDVTFAFDALGADLPSLVRHTVPRSQELDRSAHALDRSVLEGT